MTAPAVNSTWRDRNGIHYKVAAVARHVVPTEPVVVVYVGVNYGTIWYARLEDWPLGMAPADN